jgi:diadenosine tetraphosphate (Ap4A) HIT family hydrolase
VRDLSEWTTFPFVSPVEVRPLEPAVEAEPPRFGEGGVDCGICTAPDSDFLWAGERWRLSLYTPSPFPGVVLLQPRVHAESVAELPPAEAAEFGPLVGHVQRAVESLGGIGRVHLNYWGDGGAHFHLWFYPRPHGRLQLRGTFLGMWSVLLPNLPDEETRAAGEAVARALAATWPPPAERPAPSDRPTAPDA